MKLCSSCERTLPLENFHVRRASRDGRAAHCSDCRRAYSRDYYRTHRSRWNRYRPTGQVERERSRDYDAAHRDEAKARVQAFRKDHPDHHRNWIRHNPEKNRQNVARSRAKREGVSHDYVSYEGLIEEFGMVCHICDLGIASLSDLHFDHIVPLERGGAHTYDNVRPAHAACNRAKGKQLLSEMTANRE